MTERKAGHTGRNIVFAGALQGSMADETHDGAAKHPKIIVRLKRPPTKKSKVGAADATGAWHALAQCLQLPSIS